jgi:hypothetical protein
MGSVGKERSAATSLPGVAPANAGGGGGNALATYHLLKREAHFAYPPEPNDRRGLKAGVGTP